MKRNLFFNNMLFLVAALFLSFSVQAQEEAAEKKKPRPVRNTFESTWLIDNQTVMVPIKGTFQFDIQHRFGTIDNGYDDFIGLFAPSNIRMGLNYVPIENLQVGFGFTKENVLWDFNAKYALFKQAKDEGSPVSITYFVNIAVDTRNEDKLLSSKQRLSYFHQFMMARKVTKHLSLQASANLSHFNLVEAFVNEDNGISAKNENDHISFSFLGRLKITGATSIIVNYDYPLTDHLVDDPESNISFGLEFTSSAHAFQIFLGNFKSLVPQYNNVFNQNNFGDGELLIGFNITRLWNF